MQNLLIPTRIVYSNRKSISLIIETNGDFIVRAPYKATERQIYKFINQKQLWILKKRSEQLNNAIKPIEITNGTNINILGCDYAIMLHNINRVKQKDGVIYLPAQNPKEKLIAYLKKLAKSVITSEINDICARFKFNYESISINSAKTRWGSCSGSNKLHFTYKLLLCPIDVVDYIIIHELCHTKVKNHSQKFWILVASCYPDYRNCEKWLKQNRAIVELI